MGKTGKSFTTLKDTNKHLTKAEIEQKQKAEDRIKRSLKVTKIKAPDILREDGQKLFKVLSKELLQLGLFTQLDVYNLSIYINLMLEYQELQSDLITIRKPDFGINQDYIIYYSENPVTLSKLQKECIKEIKSIGGLLGLNIGDRLKFIQMLNMDIEEEIEDKFDKKLNNIDTIEIKPLDEDLLNKLNNIDFNDI